MSTGSIKHNIEITDSADAERFVEALEKAKAESEGVMDRLTKAKRLIELVNNPYCLGPVALLEGVKEVVPALIAENGQLRASRDSQQRIAIREMEKVDKLTKDKDEQAGRLMKMDYLLRRTLPILEVANDQQGLIDAINALLGGKEDA